MFKTIIEFMDGKIRAYPTRHLARATNTTYRLTYKEEEIDFPLCNIRTIRTQIVPDDSPPIIEA